MAASGGPTQAEDTPEEVVQVRPEEGTPVLDEMSPVYGMWVRGERQWYRAAGQGAVEEPGESGEGARESLQARIERELAGGQEEEQEMRPGPVVEQGEVQVGDLEGAGQMTDEVVEWVARQLMEDERECGGAAEGGRKGVWKVGKAGSFLFGGEGHQGRFEERTGGGAKKSAQEEKGH